MTVTEAYNTDDTLRGLIDYWIKEKICPFPLADRFYDLDMPNQAETVKMITALPKRPKYYSSPFTNVEMMYVYPNRASYKSKSYYFYITREIEHRLAHHLPTDNGIDRFISDVSEKDVILRLLEEYELVKSPNS